MHTQDRRQLQDGLIWEVSRWIRSHHQDHQSPSHLVQCILFKISTLRTGPMRLVNQSNQNLSKFIHYYSLFELKQNIATSLTYWPMHVWYCWFLGRSHQWERFRFWLCCYCQHSRFIHRGEYNRDIIWRLYIMELVYIDCNTLLCLIASI